jgi:hypothetical protein
MRMCCFRFVSRNSTFQLRHWNFHKATGVMRQSVVWITARWEIQCGRCVAVIAVGCISMCILCTAIMWNPRHCSETGSPATRVMLIIKPLDIAAVIVYKEWPETIYRQTSSLRHIWTWVCVSLAVFMPTLIFLLRRGNEVVSIMASIC